MWEKFISNLCFIGWCWSSSAMTTTCYSLRSQADIKHVVIFLKYYNSCWIWSQSWSGHANMAHRRCIGLLTIHTVVYVEATCSPARTHAQYTFLLSNTQPLSRCGIILMPDGNICRPKRAEVELVQISSVGNAAAGQNTATLTGPLLFRDMFFHSRRWSWCRNPIFLLTFTSRCPKCNKSA